MKDKMDFIKSYTINLFWCLVCMIGIYSNSVLAQSFHRQNYVINNNDVTRNKTHHFRSKIENSYLTVVVKYPKSENLNLQYSFSPASESNIHWQKIEPDAHTNNETDYHSALLIGGGDVFFYINIDGYIKSQDSIYITLTAQQNFKQSIQTSSFVNNECQCLQPDFYNRTQWGCPWGDSSVFFTPEFSNLSHFVVHHQAGNALPPYSAVVRAIWDFHVNSNGWSDIGYHWLIDPEGKIYKGRAWLNQDENVLGAHMCGCNANKMGICLLGNFSNSKPTQLQYQSLVNFLAYKTCEKNISPIQSSISSDRTSGTCQTELVDHLISHRDGCPINYTECPGQSFYDDFDALIQAANAAYENCKKDLSSVNFSKGNEIVFSPNPFNDELSINQFIQHSNALKIIDLMGRTVSFEILSANQFETKIKLDAVQGIFIIHYNNINRMIIKDR